MPTICIDTRYIDILYRVASNRHNTLQSHGSRSTSSSTAASLAVGLFLQYNSSSTAVGDTSPPGKCTYVYAGYTQYAWYTSIISAGTNKRTHGWMGRHAVVETLVSKFLYIETPSQSYEPGVLAVHGLVEQQH